MALDDHPTLAIGIPFTPTVGCRIDFGNIPMDSLTPSTMLNTKLIFSPIKKLTDLTPKRPNLSIISEEAVDISKELDCYQLELENNLNEAKLTKKQKRKSLIEQKQRNNFINRLFESASSNENKIQIENEAAAAAATPPPIEEYKKPNIDSIQPISLKMSNDNEMDKTLNENPDVIYEEVLEEEEEHLQQQQQPNIIENEVIEDREEEEVSEVIVEELIQPKTEQDENHFEHSDNNDQSDDENQIKFRNPAPFVRTYRRDLGRCPIKPNQQKESIETSKEQKSKETNEMFGGIRSSIRKSIRKFMHSNPTKSKSNENVASKEKYGFNTPISNSGQTSLFSSIRRSLRRKQPKQPLATSTPCQSLHDISVIDNTPRTVFKQPDLAAALHKIVAKEANKDDGTGNVFKGQVTIRRSFRKSSRHVMKSVFNKNIEDYQLEN